MPRLRVIVDGKETVQREVTGPLVIGRGEECDLRLRDTQVSRQHCRIEPGEEGWILIDLDSRNGTVLDGRPVQRHVLKDGDHLRVGSATLRFEAARLADQARSLDDEVLELLSQDAPSPQVPPGSFLDEEEDLKPDEQDANATRAEVALEPQPATPAAIAPPPPPPAPVAAAVPTRPAPTRKPRSLWEEAMKAEMKPPAARSPKKPAAEKQRVGLSDRLRKALQSLSDKPDENETKSKPGEERKWYHRKIRPGVAIAASIIVFILIYLLVWGFPSSLTFSHPAPNKALPHASPYNRD